LPSIFAQYIKSRGIRRFVPGFGKTCAEYIFISRGIDRAATVQIGNCSMATKKQPSLTPATGQQTHTKTVPVDFIHAYQTLPAPVYRLTITAQKIYSGEHVARSKAVHVVFCSDHVIKKLNTQFRNKPKATDVLSFNYDEEDFIGEIYISLQRAAIQARRYNSTYDDEIERLFVHGMMHLLGFDHEKESDRTTMEAREAVYRAN
jgi:probable rRNA maturation factor